MIRNEIARRRTFAIISHPDAGKTTLTEKLLLYGGALELAGSVTAKKKQRDTSSDWMELEKKRGISVSSTVLQFEYGGFRLNLLDTPGHRDFSEDTYRVLTAVDAVVMVIDAGKGIESQTRKLFEICRRRGVPIFTFVNKLDRPSMPSLELIDQLEQVLGLHAYPMNWPIGDGPTFRGVFDRTENEVHLFERVPGGAYRAPVSVHDASDPLLRSLFAGNEYGAIMEELEILDGAHGGFDRSEVERGSTTPVFFGSAANNFGVELLLRRFLEYSKGPSPRRGAAGTVELDHPAFSGFIFKVQTNMNPLHRDRMVFARVCSGKFVRDMSVYHSRLKKQVRLSSAHTLFGRERETMDEAYAGDILGFVTNTPFRVGDTISEDPSIEYDVITRFAPECFAYLNAPGGSAYKTFRKGVEHLLAEDIVQTFHVDATTRVLPLLGAVGPLQFEVLQYRLKEEYGVESSLEMMPWSCLRWLGGLPREEGVAASLPHGAVSGTDESGRPVLLFPSDWSMEYFAGNNPGVELLTAPPELRN
ncbi:MAG: peptide chain release factor 3 [Spirochaetes bacterium]|nr:peptide chain release factor 3 [Spirochaetota bacterium]